VAVKLGNSAVSFFVSFFLFQDCERAPLHDPNAKWLVGYGRITYNEVMLIGVVQVSAGSWMPILQLMNRVVM
jgi:hypothetical protein